MALDWLTPAFARFVLPPFERNGSGASRPPPNTPRRQGGSASYALPARAEEIRKLVNPYIWSSLSSLSALETAMIRRSTVLTIQACGAVVRMSGMSAFRRCTIHSSRVIAHEVDRDNKI